MAGLPLNAEYSIRLFFNQMLNATTHGVVGDAAGILHRIVLHQKAVHRGVSWKSCPVMCLHSGAPRQGGPQVPHELGCQTTTGAYTELL